MNVLVLNAGSSTLKCDRYSIEGVPPSRAPDPDWEAQDRWGGLADVPAVTRRLLDGLDPARPPDAVGHRVVHGGDRFHEAVRIDGAVKSAIRELSELAPLHNPLALAAIETAEERFAGIPQIAVFDTAFHWTLPPEARAYGGPYQWIEQGIRKYGFHGISHSYVARRCAEVLGSEPTALRLVTCHLGNGCSLAAVRAGRSVDTTMGFTPLDGLVMGSRSGSVDPGILIHLLRRGATVEELDHVLEHGSGLFGLSGVSSDLRPVLAAAARGDERARLAVAVFVRRLAASIASLVPALGGLDAVAFTAGIGEHSGAIRAATCALLDPLGVTFDPARDAGAGDRVISVGEERPAALVVHTRESWEVARACVRLVGD